MSFDESKCKINLKLALNRFKIQKNKKVCFVSLGFFGEQLLFLGTTAALVCFCACGYTNVHSYM